MSDEVKVQIVRNPKAENTKAPVEFNVYLDRINNVGEETETAEEQLGRSIKTHLESSLYRWDTFVLALPEPIRPDGAELNPRDLVPLPDFNELDEIATDDQGNSKRITGEQLKQIRHNGEFQVPSVNFPGQMHTWKLNRLFQRGQAGSRKTLRQTLAKALKFIVIFARNRFIGNHFSLKETVKNWGKVPRMIVDIVIGWPWNKRLSLDGILKHEQERFLAADMYVAEEDRPTLDELQSLVFKALTETWRQRNNGGWGGKAFDKSQVKLVYNYFVKSPISDNDEIKIDCTLLNQIFWEKVASILDQILAKIRNNDEWFREIRDRLIKEKKEAENENGSPISDKDIEESVNNEIKTEFYSRLYKNIQEDKKIQALGPLVSKFLVEESQTKRIIRSAEFHEEQSLARTLEELETTLNKRYPIRSLINRWMREQRAKARSVFEEENKWMIHDECMSEGKKLGLHRFVYFLDRLQKYKEVEQPKLRAELGDLKEPARVFRWRQKIWRPDNWVVTQMDMETGEQVRILPNKFNLDENMESAKSKARSYDNVSARYSVEKEMERQTSTQYPFWRWRNFGYRYWTWTCNFLFTTLILIPWCSAFSIRALISATPFFPGYRLNENTGILHRDPYSKTQSFISRIRALWRHIHKSRARFEATEDRGFLGKSVTRPTNKLWNYVIKGAFGTIILVFTIPFLCIIISTASLLAAFTAPVSVFLAVFAKHLFCIFIFDLDGIKGSGKNRHVLYIFDWLFWRVIMCGILQPITALITAIILCPLGSIFTTIAGYLRYGVRNFWDAAMFHILIKRFARIPSTNSFVARRTTGPGLSANYFFQIKPEQALALLELKIEALELDEYQTQTVYQIDRPIKELEKAIHKLFGPFSASVDSRSLVYEFLAKDASYLKTEMRNEIVKRRKKLVLSNVSGSDLRRIRLTKADLTLTLRVAGELLRTHYPKRIFPRLRDMNEEQFWKWKDLAVGDWEGLGKELFQNIFSEEFVVPMEEGEVRFKLEVEHIDMSEYMNQLLSAEHREDLDTAVPTQAPPLKRYDIHMPNVGSSEFSSAIGHKAVQLGWSFKNSQRSIKLPDIATLMALLYNKKLDESSPQSDADEEGRGRKILVDNPACKRILSDIAYSNSV